MIYLVENICICLKFSVDLRSNGAISLIKRTLTLEQDCYETRAKSLNMPPADVCNFLFAHFR